MSPVDYRDVIVKKPWGYEYLIFENNFVAIWMLQIIRKRRTSMHCHPNKKTGLVLLSGNATTYSLEGAVELSSLDSVIIENSVFHATEASSSLSMIPHSENGIWVMEIESPPIKTDLLRLKDEYGRAGASYEGTENMVFEPRECLKLQVPATGEVLRKTYLDCQFTVRRGLFKMGEDLPALDALVSVIGRESAVESDNPYLRIGELVAFNEFYEKTRREDLDGYTILIVERAYMVKVSDYIFSFIAELGVKDVFAVCGGGAMHLVDSLGRNENLKYIATHHEQAAAMAAEGYARISGKPGVALVTSGPGGTNAITGVYGAWIDSIPTIFISGQVTSDTLIKDTGLRQFGIQEANITELVRPITKYAVTVTDANEIKYHLQKAVHLATTGRPGPVWLDIPLNVQSKLVNPAALPSFTPDEVRKGDTDSSLKIQVAESIELLKKAKRPVIISGYGIRLASAEKEFLRLIERLMVPVISSWTTSDLIPTSHELYIGRSGIMGDRAGNFAVQNSDLLLIIGSRMSIPQIGFNYKTFAREAKKIMVDIDDKELKKPSIIPDLPIKADAKEFMAEMLSQLEDIKLSLDISEWVQKCQYWKAKYPVVLPEYKEIKEGVNSFYFIDVLSERLGNDAIVVTDMGTSFTCTMQTFKTKLGQRLFTSSGHASMGFGLPGAIGACFANNLKKTICISGDGGLQMNIQELQTLVHYNLPVILFVLNNGGYLTIMLMQQNHFGKYVGSEPSSGLSCPDIIKVGAAYGIKTERISNNEELHARIDNVLAEAGPFICEIMMPLNQQLIPRVSSLKKPDGTITAKPLEDLYPFLSREEFLENMIVPPVEILKH
ncbi:MAG: thiamine pyrophosphate-binding protein [Nitrospirae bacterium]|nr:thiamine pyrophosphate-binding protein [Nitrospirota bacterium]